LRFPIVATSGNISDEPMCTTEEEALHRLGHIADSFLVHNRPIVRPVDDSVVRVAAGRQMILRRARGYAPLPIDLPPTHSEGVPTLLAVGGQLKNTVALAVGNQTVVSQHIGDLEAHESEEAFRKAITDLSSLYIAPDLIVSDFHPNYTSTRYAQQSGLPVVQVQHHYAHVASCMAENQLHGTVLGVSWDGTGWGLDGTVWGGEFLVADEHSFGRVASLRAFPLPGGEKAIREPRRTALGVLFQVYGVNVFERDDIPAVHSFTCKERTMIRQMMQHGVNAPTSSSVGRLFDAVASLLGIRQCVSFEGQAAMELEFAIDNCVTEDSYDLPISTPDDTDRQQPLSVD
jgi:hydrogenase maturation protein HypF